MTTWLAGILEVTSKVRYGLTSRGTPLYKFIPYDKRWNPLAVGCSTRDFTTNIHVVVEPSSKDVKMGQMAQGNLVRTLGSPTSQSEEDILLLTYAYDSKKELRKFPETLPAEYPREESREIVSAYTFHIDPKGCMDVDDAFSFSKIKGGWRVMIHIADVDAWIEKDSPLDNFARQRSTSFYSPEGFALAPMLPTVLSESRASLLPGVKKPAVSLAFDWIPGKPILDVEWKLTLIQTQETYTYESAMANKDTDHIAALRELAVQLGGDISDSHTWVQELMIFYNEHAAQILHKHKRGILRRHSPPKKERLKQIAILQEQGFEGVCMEAAEYCLATQEDVSHYGLRRSVYAYVTSPIRRYADIVNQRILKEIISKQSYISNPTEEIICQLNYRQKQSKAFSRDILFMNIIASSKPGDSVKGLVVEVNDKASKVWVSEWKRFITIKSALSLDIRWYTITWYANREIANWKDRIVFHARPLSK
jgi:exoribonuclease R